MMKFAAILTLSALALSAGAANAQNANDRPGMTAPQEGTMTQPNQPGSMSNPQRAPQQPAPIPEIPKPWTSKRVEITRPWSVIPGRAYRFADKSVASTITL